MPKFIVTLRHQVVRNAVVEVEAPDLESVGQIVKPSDPHIEWTDDEDEVHIDEILDEDGNVLW